MGREQATGEDTVPGNAAWGVHVGEQLMLVHKQDDEEKP